ncbi:hypothetical protein [Endozoicomonas numazuensis]|uniref:SET domain-containing protein n=1 Tax=Endozoicomonas numazuensis TaxID=1137799 RepID=A0A081NEP5_9GAMM|nr:hypothetical protein [Endozoicomonas numazuensis]KEQ16918.1 hypothetical protein GZ78_19965 [Endozoicomonas numazuensis]
MTRIKGHTSKTPPPHRKKRSPVHTNSGKTPKGKEVSVRRPKRHSNGYIVNKQTGFPAIKAKSKEIGPVNMRITNRQSRIPAAGMGAFTKRSFRQNELIGCFQGRAVYAMEVAGQDVCMFTLEGNRVRLLSSATHLIWTSNITKEFPQKDQPAASLKYGIHVEGLLKFINYDKAIANVRAKPYIKTGTVQESTKEGEEHYFMKPSASMKDCIEVVALANQDIGPDTELFLDYAPEAQNVDFEKMDDCPAEQLLPEQKSALLQLARSINPKVGTSGHEDDWLIAAKEREETPSLDTLDSPSTSVSQISRGTSEETISSPIEVDIEEDDSYFIGEETDDESSDDGQEPPEDDPSGNSSSCTIL